MHAVTVALNPNRPSSAVAEEARDQLRSVRPRCKRRRLAPLSDLNLLNYGLRRECRTRFGCRASWRKRAMGLI